MHPSEIDRIVSVIDETRRTEHFRDNDCRPDSRPFKPKSTGRRVPPEIVRAQTRLRSAAWRNRMDRLRAPSSREIGMALVHVLINSRLQELTWTDRDLVQRALLDLHGRGYSIEQAKKTLRRMRTRYVDAADRAGEADENCGPAIGLPGEKHDLPF